MVNIYDVFSDDLIRSLTLELKKIDAIKPPKDAKFWKTAHFREFPPVEEDFWWTRAASLLRKLYRKSIGVNRLRKDYGGRTKNHSHRKHTKRGSGKIIRLILQQLGDAGLVQVDLGKGRSLTGAGRSLLDKVANEIARVETVSN